MQTFYPVLKFNDARAAIDFLEKAFGMERGPVYEGDDGAVSHAQFTFGGEVMMLGSTGQGDTRFDQCAGNSSIYVAVDDPDPVFERAQRAGAQIERGLEEMDYGSREFTARDPEGNLWTFGTYRPAAGDS